MALLNIDELTLLASKMEPVILREATLGFGSNDLKELEIDVLTNIEYQSNAVAFQRRNGIARRYRPGHLKTLASIGRFYENPLRVFLAAAKLQDNIQNYRAKECYSILGTDGGFDPKGLDLCMDAMMEIADSFADQVGSNLFFGVGSYEDDADALSLFDGFDTIITNASAGENALISADAGNLKNVTFDIDLATADADALKAYYLKHVAWYNSLDPRMRRKNFNVYLTRDHFAALGAAYAATYAIVNPESTLAPGFKFAGLPNAIFKPNDLMGTGDKMIATVPYNLQYGTDLTSVDQNRANLQVWLDNDDRSVVNYQIMAAMGARIKQFTPDKFSVTGGTLTPFELTGYEPNDEEKAYEEAHKTSVAGGADTKWTKDGESVFSDPKEEEKEEP